VPEKATTSQGTPFQDGWLIQWRAHLESRTPRDLAKYDDATAWLIERRRAA
jgi:hypothetical protein